MYVDTTADERMARMRARRKASGLVEVRVWVRPDQVDQVRSLAAATAQAAPPVPQTIVDPAREIPDIQNFET